MGAIRQLKRNKYAFGINLGCISEISDFYRPLGCFGHFGTIWDELRIFYFEVKKKNQASFKEAWITVILLTQILDICSFGGGFMRLFGRKRLFLVHMKEKYYIFTSLN